MHHSCHKYRDVAMLLTRLIVGGIFIYSGWLKVADMGATVGFFAQMGIPALLAYTVAYLELIGGVMLVLGLYTCLAAAVLAVIMLFAIWYTRGMGFQGFATPLATLAALLALFGVCGGKYSLKSCRGSSCGGDSYCGGSSEKCCTGGICEECRDTNHAPSGKQNPDENIRLGSLAPLYPSKEERAGLL